jgi:AcrR family transcriptional regulator
VGDIEAAAGLQPRRGGLYRHFSSKQALLEAAVETHLDAMQHARQGFGILSLRDRRDEAMLMGQLVLAQLDAQRYLTRILEQDGDRLPAIRDLIRERIVDMAFGSAEEVLRRWLGEASKRVDTKAWAVLVLTPLVEFRRTTWTYGRPPLDIDDERFLSCWVEACVALTDHYAQAQARPTRRSPRKNAS